MNLLEKLHAILVSDKVNVWHFYAKQEGPQFYYWRTDEPDNKDGHGCETLEELIESAYRVIDPLAKPLPDRLTAPPQALERSE